MADDQELLAIRARLHEVSGQLHAATVRVEVTATRLDHTIAILERIERRAESEYATAVVHLAGIETAVRELQTSKANLDGRLLILATITSMVVTAALWIVTRWVTG